MTNAAAHPTLRFREATREDLPRIVELIRDDAVAADRTGTYSGAHERGFDAVVASPNDELIVAELDGEVIGVMQLTFIPGIARRGVTRLHVEAVRVDRRLRGRGFGESMMRHAEERGNARGCGLAQLTSDVVREDAHRFYERLGYAPSHVGFKKQLSPVELHEVAVDDPLARQAQQAYVTELHEQFGFAPGPLDVPEPGSRYLVAVCEDRPVAYGGIRPAVGRAGAIIDGAAEIKRMWVHPERRGTGLASRLVRRLEELAGAAGNARVLLDTHSALREAIAFYERAGYRRVDRYNDSPDAELFFAKDLS
ncbi:GNAT family N-acetyltransferase [Nesterenkonia sp. CL21]|uniref:GNAT family N-acetyltransferase n=1 Tax=Nesterenkonia sp. CL21 TaxID=3064894 RepID=UPI0028784EC0|nr:GNAT family N-acetyltransferase [Nesterenkonia sp. CL21]MDS2172298.1 GNAT family N-acetyltransferase [Nesterenkonia sp. CL21]